MIRTPMASDVYELLNVGGRDWMVPRADTEARRVVFDAAVDYALALKTCKQKRIAIQAGGCWGTYPAYLAKHFAQVYTFEPDPSNYQCLKYNLQTEPTVLKMQAALHWNSDERCALIHDKRNAGATYVDPHDESRGVSMVALDDLGFTNVDLIALDVEGYELMSLQGGIQLIERCRPVIQIEDKGHGSRYGVRIGEVGEWLEQFGYRLRGSAGSDMVYPT